MGLKEKIISCDQFGALFQLSVQGDDPQYKSLSGALATIAINTTAIVYFIYLVYLWISNQTIPTIANQVNFISEGKTFNLTESPFYFTVESYDNDTLKTFKGIKLYDVQTQFFYNGEVYQEQSYAPECRNKLSTYFMDFFDPICLDINDPNSKTITQNYAQRYLDDYFGYYLYPCDTNRTIQKLNKLVNSSCISENKAKEFLTDLNADARITLVSKEFDIDNEEFKELPFDYYFPLAYQQRTVLNVYLQVTKLNLIRGIIFPTSNTIEYVSKIDLKPQSILRNEGDPYVVIWVSLSRQEITTNVDFPKLPEILAQFSFIFSGLMTFGIFFNYINGRQMKKKLIHQIGNIYFQNFPNLDEEEKKRKKKNQKSKNDQQDKTLQGMKRISNLLFSKCNFLNMMYEISRLQCAVSTLLTKEHLQHIQFLRFKLDSSLQDNEFNEKIKNTNELGEDNFTLFTMEFTKDLEKDIQLPCEINDDYFSRVLNIIKSNSILKIAQIKDLYPLSSQRQFSSNILIPSERSHYSGSDLGSTPKMISRKKQETTRKSQFQLDAKL